jgi:prepilin-type N-terminal cleavage/methylation domain-containing protein
MVLKNIKDNRKDHGFTIVELLVVIVVIGILAAITIVSYTGITARANTSKNQANAQSIQSVVEAMNADNGFYPAKVNDTVLNYGIRDGSSTTKAPAGVTLIVDAATEVITATNNTTSISYACFSSCTSSTGGRIGYWDYTNGIKYVYVGAAVSTGPWAYPTN